MSTNVSLKIDQLAQSITTYAGFVIFISGILGNLLNIIIFLTLRTFIENSSVFYLMIMSFVNIGNLTTGLLSRILISGFNLDWTLISSFYCKFRWYLLQFGVLTSFTCTCLASIDQYISTSILHEWPRSNNIKTARRLMATFITAWLLHGIPYFIFFELNQSPTSNQVVCTSVNIMFRRYHIYGYLIVLAGVVPLLITSFFGLLAHYNVKNSVHTIIPLVQRCSDQQLTKMVLNQLFYNVIFTGPYTLFTIIVSFRTRSKDSVDMAKLNFAHVMTILFYYISFAVS